MAVLYPETTVYVSGNSSIVTSISMGSNKLSTILVIAGSSYDHSSSIPANRTTANANGASSGGTVTTSALGNATLPKTNMTECCTAESKALLPSATRAGPTTTKVPLPAGAFPSIGNIHVPSQVGPSVTTLTTETTVTELPTFTCTINHPCSFHGNNGTALGSLTPLHIPHGPTSGSSGLVLPSSGNSIKIGTTDIVFTSSTMTKTITLVKSSAGVFAPGTTSNSGTVITEKIVPIAPSSASTTEDLGHVTTSVNTVNGSLVNSTPVLSISIASTSILSNSTTSISTMSTLMTSTSMTNTSMANATSNDAMSFTSLSLSSMSMESSVGSSTMPMLITSAPTSTTSSSLGSVGIIPTSTKTIVKSSGARASPPRLFALMLHLFSYFGQASTEYSSTTLSTTTTWDSTTYLTKTPTDCFYHPEIQPCMTNLGYNNPGVRPSASGAAVLADFLPIVASNTNEQRTDPVSSTITVTLTVLKNAENDASCTSVRTFLSSILPAPVDFTTASASFVSIPAPLDFTDMPTTLVNISPTRTGTILPTSTGAGLRASAGGAEKETLGGLLAVVGGVLAVL